MAEKKAAYKNHTETKRRFTTTQLELLAMARLARRQKSKSLGDLVNLRKDLDDKLDGKVRRLSARPGCARRLGLISADNAKSVESQSSSQTQQLISTAQRCLTSVHKRKSFTPPPTPDNSVFLKKIVKEQATDTRKQELTKVRLGDILQSASLMEFSYLNRSTGPVCCRPLCNHVPAKSGRNSESAFSLGHFRPNKKRIVVRMPSVYDIGESSSQCHFSYRHKK